MVSTTRLLGGSLALFGFLFALHYVLFGSFPVGTPALLDSAEDDE